MEIAADSGVNKRAMAATAATLAVIAGLALLFVYVIFPWGDRKDAAQARHDAQRITAIQHQGFIRFNSTYLDNDAVGQYFRYQVGACDMLIYVTGYKSGFKTYILLKTLANPYTPLYVTYDKMKRLPQTEPCFVK